MGNDDEAIVKSTCRMDHGVCGVLGFGFVVAVVVGWRRPGGSLDRCIPGCGSDG